RTTATRSNGNPMLIRQLQDGGNMKGSGRFDDHFRGESKVFRFIFAVDSSRFAVTQNIISANYCGQLTDEFWSHLVVFHRPRELVAVIYQVQLSLQTINRKACSMKVQALLWL